MLGAAGLLLAIAAGASRAGVVNPDISVIGQPVFSVTDNPSSPDRNRPRLEIGETEFVFDSYLNPYAKGSLRKVTSPSSAVCRSA
jgi:hypothetical protein